ncbi:MAG: hypothetical protein LBJ72_08345 [Dysgonamonadaceae bacterium]|jgi:hypothetical protein|nr:hypothetical protein [Dysgonamonadaceae bacterium]
MKNSVHNELILALKSQISQDANPAEVLMKLLSISKEGAYRRLRGEIQLSLDEAVILAKQLDISLDNLIEIKWDDKYAFHITPFSINPGLKEYRQTLMEIMDSYTHLIKDPNCYAYIISKLLSPILYFKYPDFSRFAIYRWIYLQQYSTKYAPLSGITVPDEIKEIHQSLPKIATQIPTTYILNDYIFTSLAKDLTYLLKIKLLTKNEVEVLKEQIIMVINDLEEIAVRGSYKDGAKVTIYIADTYFDISYHYVNGNGFEACSLEVYGLNFLSCLNPEISHNQKIWIESQIKYSTSITRCGEAQRMNFFNKQRKIINEIRAQ